MVHRELERLSRHAEWVSYYRHGRTGGPPPAPEYKDCRNCPLRGEYDTLQERAEFCESACPWPDLPPGPPSRFTRALLWSQMPEGFLVEYAAEIGLDMVMDAQAIRMDREQRRMMPVMGSSRGRK